MLAYGSSWKIAQRLREGIKCKDFGDKVFRTTGVDARRQDALDGRKHVAVLFFRDHSITRSFAFNNDRDRDTFCLNFCADQPGETASDLLPTFPQPQSASASDANGTSNSSTANEDERFEAAYEYALKSSGRPFAFTQLCLVGEGRAGKTALARSLCDKPFVQTDSTIGVGFERMEVDRIDVRVDTSAGKWRIISPDKQLGSFVDDQVAWDAAQMMGGAMMARSEVDGSMMELITSLEPEVVEQPLLPSSPKLQHTTSIIQGAAVAFPPNSSSAPNAGPPAADAHTSSVGCSVGVSSPTNPLHMAAGSEDSRSAAAPVTRLNKQMVLRRSKEREPLRVNLLDFGGQEAFYSLHHLYLTRYAVYLVVFNMEWLAPSADIATKQRCIKFLSFWLNSIFLHARAPVGYKSGRIAPILLIGSHKDKVRSPADHEAISTLLYDRFGSSPVWSSVVEFSEGTVSSGRGVMWFFPSMCGEGAVDPMIEKIKANVQQTLANEEYLKCKVALPWLQALDAMQSKNVPFMMLEEVEAISRTCGLPVTHLSLEEEVTRMLKYFTQLGLLMHHDRSSLRRLVVLDTMQCLVNPASVIMCQHDIHQLPVHKHARRFNDGHLYRLLTKGELDTRLLPILWPEHSRITIEIEQLMVFYGLLVPLLKQDTDTTSLHRYLIPTLLPQLCESSPAPVYCHFYFVFGMAEQLMEWRKIGHFLGRDAASLGFCPNGLFARLTGKIVSECQCTYQNYQCTKGRSETCAAFGRHAFTVRELPELNMIQLLVQVQNPRFLVDELERLVEQVVSEMIPSLSFVAAVFADGSTGPNFQSENVAAARLVVMNGDNGFISLVHDDLPLPVGESIPLSSVEARKRFEPWLPPVGLRSDGYDVFLSYRCVFSRHSHSNFFCVSFYSHFRWTGSFEDDLTMGIFNALSFGEHGVLGSSGREIRVFLDKQRLQDGRNFQQDFADALLKTSVPVIILSTASLQRMQTLTADSAIDNLLLEWTLIVELLDRDAHILAECLPIFVGTFDRTASTCSAMITSLFRDNVISSLPDVAVASIIDKVRCILQQHGISESPHLSDRTVRSVVRKLELQMAVQSWKLLEEPRLALVQASHVKEEVTRTVVTHCAKKIRHILEQRVADEEAARDLLSRQQQEQQQQPVESVESAEDIVQRLVSVLARAEIVPVDKRVQFAKTLYDIGISNQHMLRDSVLGASPDIDLAIIGMNPIQKKALLKYLCA
jgi:GTPase SAR1 family protein